jgi:hypothetical protein
LVGEYVRTTGLLAIWPVADGVFGDNTYFHIDFPLRTLGIGGEESYVIMFRVEAHYREYFEFTCGGYIAIHREYEGRNLLEGYPEYVDSWHFGLSDAATRRALEWAKCAVPL